ncbi:hypothetical protein [Winogradskyella sp.]|uniref:hypothetical protein n=1 Tax=Winogradskyella sp. TaxID=1883156 RepID=UPI003BA8ADB0
MKNLKNLGKVLNRNEQKNIFGGNDPVPVDCSFSKSDWPCLTGQGVFIDGKCCVYH